MSVGEEYNDNIFFSKDRVSDFITVITPNLTLLYAPPTEIAPTFTLNIAPSGLLYARHSELNNFGENLSLNGGYTYRYSPRLQFHVADTLRRSSQSRSDLARDGLEGLPRPVTGFPPPGAVDPVPGVHRLGDFTSAGDTLRNHFSVSGRYLYSPDITFTANYTNNYASFLDIGGNELINRVGIRGTYHWWPQHNLHAGFGISVIRSRDGDNNVVPNFDFGDDFFDFTNFKILLAPTLTLSGSLGLAVNTGKSGPRVANTANLTLIKIWELASFSLGVRRGITGSFGVSGPSLTTTFFSDFNIRLTERLSGTAGVNYSLLDTSDVNFDTFLASAGLQYWITSWLSSSLRYAHRFRTAGAGANDDDLIARGHVRSNSVFLVFSAHFNLWPRLGLARELSPAFVYPVEVPQAPTQPSAPEPQRAPSPSGAPAPSVSP
ncbi:MAG TPA: hypothetical protein VNL14_18860 [Candidatus Acidoferrales bacterium]|nr:hypothetical protein [Candidatus Acidoferrales bacterium]